MQNPIKRLIARIIVVALLAGCGFVAIASAIKQAQQPQQQPRPAITQVSPEEAAREMNNPRSKWFREAKYGLFIHWGLYAIPAGTWKGQQIPGIGEWIMNRAKIPVKEYEQLANQFNPVKFNADEWAQLAADAGMKYLTITSKHHDGFAIFKSQVSRYNIVDATPFKRDPMKELQAACDSGNYLLNVGPTAEGIIPQPSQDVLRAVGRWLKVNGEAIYGTGITPFGSELKDRAWRSTTKPGKLYIHLFTWPAGEFTLEGVKGKVTKTYLLADPKHKGLKFSQTNGNLTVTLPEKAPGEFDSVLCLETR